MKFFLFSLLIFSGSRVYCFDLGSFAGSVLDEHKVDAALSVAKVTDETIFEKKNAASDLKYLDEPKIKNYVNDKVLVLQKMGNHPLGVLSLLDQSDAQAWINLVGGDIFITKGMLLEVKNDAELFGILAQQVGKFDLSQNDQQQGLSVAESGYMRTGSEHTLKSQKGAYFATDQISDFASAHSEKVFNEKAVCYAADKLVALGYDPTEYLHLLQRLSKSDDESFGGKARRLKEGTITASEQAQVLESYLKSIKIPVNPKDPGAGTYVHAMASLNSVNGAPAEK
jgi:hypothetical protein